MTTPTVTGATRDYLSAVERELGDLPADERAELLEDLALHLAALEEEGDERPLATRLGSSAEYARELRAAAGLPPRTAGKRGARGLWGRLASLVTATSAWREVRAFLPQLQPAWWVLRGYLVVLLPSLWDGGGARHFPVPALWGEHLLGLLLVVAAVVTSVRLGRRELPRIATVGVSALNVLVALAALDLVADAPSRLTRVVVVSDQQQTYSPLASDHGLVTNIFPYTADGTPLSGVLLFDQDGRPLRSGQQEWWPDGCRRVPAQPRAADGVPVPFVYPQQYVLDPAGTTLDGLPVTAGQCEAVLSRPPVPLPTFGPPAVKPSPQPTSR